MFFCAIAVVVATFSAILCAPSHLFSVWAVFFVSFCCCCLPFSLSSSVHLCCCYYICRCSGDTIQLVWSSLLVLHHNALVFFPRLKLHKHFYEYYFLCLFVCGCFFFPSVLIVPIVLFSLVFIQIFWIKQRMLWK